MMGPQPKTESLFYHFRLVLLCYKRSAPQNGQRGSCRIRKPAISLRSVAMERGLCRPHQRGATAWAEVLRECGRG
jgi:hypothetical protein